MDNNISNYPFFNGDKHAHLRLLHIISCKKDLGKGNYNSAQQVALNFLWLYPEDKDGKEKIVELYISLIGMLVNNNKYDEAKKLVKKSNRLLKILDVEEVLLNKIGLEPNIEKKKLYLRSSLIIKPLNEKRKWELCDLYLKEFKHKFKKEIIEYFLLNIAKNLILILFCINKTTSNPHCYMFKIDGPGELKVRKMSKSSLFSEHSVIYTLRQDNNYFHIIFDLIEIKTKFNKGVINIKKDIKLKNSDRNIIRGKKYYKDILNMPSETILFDVEDYCLQQLKRRGITIKAPKLYLQKIA